MVLMAYLGKKKDKIVDGAMSMAQSEALIQLLISCIFVITEVTYPNCRKFGSYTKELKITCYNSIWKKNY